MKVTKYIVEDGVKFGRRCVEISKHTAELDDFVSDIVPYFDTYEQASMFAINCLFERVLELENRLENVLKK